MYRSRYLQANSPRLTDSANVRMFMSILEVHDIKIDAEAVSNKMGCSASALRQHINKLKRDAKAGDVGNDAATAMSGAEDSSPSTPKAKAKGAGPKRTPAKKKAAGTTKEAGTDVDIATEPDTPKSAAKGRKKAATTKTTPRAKKPKVDAEEKPAPVKGKLSKGGKVIHSHTMATDGNGIHSERYSTASDSGEQDKKRKFDELDSDLDNGDDEAGVTDHPMDEELTI